jgi:membrane protein required for colicin V production
MNYIDIALCIPLVWGFYKGFVKGLIIEAASILALGLGIWGGIHFSDFCADKIKVGFNWQSPYLPIVSFAIVFLTIIISVFLLAKLLSKLSKKLALGGLDKILGALVGSLKFALILSVIIYVINSIEKSYPVVSFDVKNKSVLYKPIGKIAPLIIPALKRQEILKSSSKN